MDESNRTLLMIMTIVASIVWYGIGLISPLTPSEGMPTTSDLIIFVFIPVLAICIWIIISKHLYEKIALGIFVLIIIGFSSWLLLLQTG